VTNTRLFLLVAGGLCAAVLAGSIGSLADARTGGPATAQTVPVPASCGAGDPLVDVTQTVLNALDSDASGNYVWAYDRTATMRVRYWKTGDRTFCEARQIEGTFESVDGDSPAKTGVIHPGITGTFHSLDAWTFTGAYDPGTHQTHGQLATIDQGCHIIDQTRYYCTVARGNIADGSSYYFPGGRGNNTLDSGYFNYDAGSRGHWLQLGNRVFGDITG
jgi:hypothetical protein